MTRQQPDLLRGLDPADAEDVIALGTHMQVPSGSALFRLGEPADNLFVVSRGRIALTLPMQISGREEDVLIEERLPGETIGWSALIPPHRFTLKATAQLDTDVLSISRAELLEYLRTHPVVGYTVARNVAEIIGQRLQIFQAMWLRQMQRVVEMRTTPARAQA
jgi:CRP-like cAMP-binding protein